MILCCSAILRLTSYGRDEKIVTSENQKHNYFHVANLGKMSHLNLFPNLARLWGAVGRCRCRCRCLSNMSFNSCYMTMSPVKILYMSEFCKHATFVDKDCQESQVDSEKDFSLNIHSLVEKQSCSEAINETTMIYRLPFLPDSRLYKDTKGSSICFLAVKQLEWMECRTQALTYEISQGSLLSGHGSWTGGTGSGRTEKESLLKSENGVGIAGTASACSNQKTCLK